MTTAGARAGRTAYRGPRKGEKAGMARMNSVMLKVVVAVVIGSVFLYISGMAGISAGSKQISALRAQIAAEESRRQQLEIAYIERHNLDMIGDLAVSRLGMVRPDASAVRVVSLPIDGVDGDAQTVYDASGE